LNSAKLWNHLNPKLQYNVDIHKQQRIVDLENELQRNQECLQVTVEELESTNEELQSSNEELLAANEELQSTNEELQSVNEELYTVNSEYQDKIEEITKINSDLDNIMKSTDVGILFLDQMLLIRNYNPAATRVINLLKSDIGRPFHHISHKLKSSTLLQDIANVIENKQPFQQELRTEDSNLVLIKITPYVIDKKSMRGCVIAITDVTETRLSAQSTEAQHNKIEHLIYETDNAAVKEATILNLLTNQMSEQFATLLDALNKQSSNQFALQKHPESALTYENVDICVFDSSDLKHPLFSKITSLDKPPALLIISEDIHSIDHQPLNQFIVDVLDKKSLTGALLESSIKHLLTLKRISHCLTP